MYIGYMTRPHIMQIPVDGEIILQQPTAPVYRDLMSPTRYMEQIQSYIYGHKANSFYTSIWIYNMHITPATSAYVAGFSKP